MSNTTRSIFDLSLEELEQVILSNELPKGVGLQGIEDRKDFAKLFKHRINPKYIAETLVKEKAGVAPKGPSEPASFKETRLALKQRELELKQAKQERTSFLMDQIYKRLQAIEDGQSVIIAGIANVNAKLAALLEK